MGRNSRNNKNRQRKSGKPSRRGNARSFGGPRPPGVPLSPGGLVKKKAVVDKNRKGFGFLAFDDRKIEDMYVPPEEANRLFHGDRVEVLLNPRTGAVASVRVLEHRFRELVGRFEPHAMGVSRGGWAVYERKKSREEVWLPSVPHQTQPGDWLKVALTFHESGQHRVTGTIQQNYGQNLPATADLPMVAAEFNLIESHTEKAEAEARSMTLEVPGRDLEGRVDLRHVPLITIDGETARDFDDAVYVEREKGGGFVLWVGIADVSHYVREGSALDTEALSRGTSVYFPEKAFHMLPRALSENLCSLKPKVPRLSMVAKMHFDAHAKRTKTEVYNAVIESRRRATYNEIQAEWEASKGSSSWEYAPHFELYRKLRKMRADRGSIDFDLPESELNVTPDGEVVSIKNRARLDAHRLIEEFMIAANEAVTVWMLERQWPFVYRVHDEPSMQSLIKFEKLAQNVGIPFRAGQVKGPKSLAELVKLFDEHPASDLLNTSLLRSMKQAIYSSTHGIHFGLASEAYTHFTSPIRRYPDLIVHRLIRRALTVEHGKAPRLAPAERDRLEKELEAVCEHTSYRERIATQAERESIRLKQVRAMIPHIGEEIRGKIVGMNEIGFFVQIPEPFVEGMVSRETLKDDFYEYQEERMRMVGRRRGKVFRVGAEVRVRVARADIERRQIEFDLLEGGEAGGKAIPHRQRDRQQADTGKKRRVDRRRRR